jgi:hypothetical protein
MHVATLLGLKARGALPTPSGYARYLLDQYFWNTGQLLPSRMCCVIESPKKTSSKPCADGLPSCRRHEHRCVHAASTGSATRTTLCLGSLSRAAVLCQLVDTLGGLDGSSTAAPGALRPCGLVGHLSHIGVDDLLHVELMEDARHV